MEIQLDHLLVSSKNRNGAAKLLAKILGVRWDPATRSLLRLRLKPPPQISRKSSGGTFEHRAPAFTLTNR
jgi:hypothetical protein